jgi:hypothetical protein
VLVARETLSGDQLRSFDQHIDWMRKEQPQQAELKLEEK